MASPSIKQVTGSPVVALVTTAETAALASDQLSVNQAGEGVVIRATVTGATGAGVTECQIRIRAGNGTTGSVIGGVFEEAQGASSFYSMNVTALDTSIGTAAAPSGTVQYTVTVQQVGASGNGTVTLANIALEPANAAGA